MVHKKTGWYTFLTPVLVGAVVAGVEESILAPLGRFATALASAFQIQDDLLNLSASEKRYGKEILGDLWEGKRTIMLLHALRNASRTDRNRALRILRRTRPSEDSASSRSTKSETDVRFLLNLMQQHGSITYAREVAFRRARRAEGILARLMLGMRPSSHRDFLQALAAFVVHRDR
jgi:geranylgeranyl diphosphate synthase type II